MANNEKTSKEMASRAGKALRDKSTNPLARIFAAALLTQAPDKPKKIKLILKKRTSN